VSIITLIASLNANAVLGPIPIYLNTEYRTDSPVIGSITSTLSFSADDIKAIDEGIEEANKFFAKVSIKDFFIGESTESPCVENYLNSI
jgi:hypothetical protein